MRICFLTHYFPPEVGAPQTRIELLARTLAAGGEEVVVHTGFPHYPAGRVAAPYRNRPWLLEDREGLLVLRSAVYPAANRGFARRIADHAAFALSALTTARLSGPLDVVISETPPLFTAAAGARYAAGKRAAHVVHVADRWPASAVELGMLTDRRAIAAAEALERWVYRHADLIAAPTEGIIRSLERLPDAAAKLRRVWPVVDVDRFPAPAAARQSETAGTPPLRLLYAGTVGLSQGLDMLVEASLRAGPELVQTTIAGDGADAARLRAMIDQRHAGNVHMLGPVPAAEIPGLYREADAAAVLLRDLPIFAGALPTKLLEAMAAGCPLLLAARGEASRLVTDSGAGLAVEPEDPIGLAGAIARLQADPSLRRTLGDAGRACALAQFGAERAAEQWAELLDDAVARR
jgi:colanic acid biosynthesis glycosyl transferase WcaI